MTLLDDRPNTDWLLNLTPPEDLDVAFQITFPDGQVFTDLLPDLPLQPYPGTEDVPWAIPGVPLLGEQPPVVLPPPSAEVARFTAAVTGLAVDLTVRTDEQVLADVAELLRAAEQLRVTQLDRLTDAAHRNVARLDNELSLRTWVRRRYDDIHRQDLPLAGQISTFPHLQAQVRAREVSVKAASLVCAALLKVRPRLDQDDQLIDGLDRTAVLTGCLGHVVDQIAGARLGLPDGHPLLLSLREAVAAILASPGSQLDKLEAGYTLLGQHVPLNLLAGCLSEQKDALLPAGLESRSLKAHDSRGLVMQPNLGQRSGGRIIIDADDELYELAYTVLGATARTDPANPDDTARKADAFGEPAPDVFGADIESQGDVKFPRSNRQRGHDSLKLLFQNYLAAGLAGSHDKTPVRITVLIGADRLENCPGSLPATGASGRSLPTSLIRQWWGDAEITGLVLSKGLIPFATSHTQRTLTARERVASKAQHRGQCSGLRCCTPHDPLVTLIPHHVYTFATYGRTAICETIWACERFHHAIHHGRTITLRDGRGLNADGWTNPPR